MKNARWTPEEKTRLRQHWSGKRTVSAIAKILGKSESAVKNQRRFLGLPPRRTGNLSVKVKAGVDKDTFAALRHKAIINRQSIPDRLRELIRIDISAPRKEAQAAESEKQYRILHASNTPNLPR